MTSKFSWSEHKSSVFATLRQADEAHEAGRLSADEYLRLLVEASESLTIPTDIEALRQAMEKALHVHVGVSSAWLEGQPRTQPAKWCAHDYSRYALLCFARAVAQVGTEHGCDCGVYCYQLEGWPPFVALEWLDQDGEPRSAVLAHEHVEGLEYE